MISCWRYEKSHCCTELWSATV